MNNEPKNITKTPRTDAVFAAVGENILDHVRELETELDAKSGIVDALENELEKTENALARAEHSRHVATDSWERAIRERDNWMQTAAEFNTAREYYRNLLDQCGQAIGKEAYTCDDGTTQQDVLVAKVPELVRGLVGERNNWQELAVANAALIQDCYAECSAHPPQPDYAQQAKDLFVKNTFGDKKDADNFVDLIIKAAKA